MEAAWRSIVRKNMTKDKAEARASAVAVASLAMPIAWLRAFRAVILFGS
jgi:hypothetical protein